MGHRRRARRPLRALAADRRPGPPLRRGLRGGRARRVPEADLPPGDAPGGGRGARPAGHARGPARARVPPPGPDLAPRHDDPGVGPRAGAALRGVRADVDPALRPGRVRQEGRARGRGVAEVLPRREPLDGGAGLRALVRLRRDRQHAARRRDAGGGRRGPAPDPGPPPGPRRGGVQDRRLPVPHVGARHLRGGGDPVRRVAVGGAEGGRVRRAAPDLRRAGGADGVALGAARWPSWAR